MNELNALQQSLTSNVTSKVTSTVTDQLNSILMAFLIPSLVVTIIFVAFYIMRIVHRHKVDKAIFEIRDTLREMKASQLPTNLPPHVKVATSEDASSTQV